MLQPGGRAQHVVGAVGHAELAGGAMVVEMPDAHGSERHERPAASGRLLVGHIGQASVEALDHLGFGQGGRPYQCGAGGEEVPPSGIDGRTVARARIRARTAFPGFRQRRLQPDETVAYRPLGAVVDAVEAEHAAAAVHEMVLHVDAGGLAAASAALACHALAFVDGEAEEREAAEDAEQGAHGADGVAVSSAAVPCEEADQREGDSCRNQQGGCEAFTSGKPRDAPDHASVGAVGGQQSEQELQAQEGAGHGDQQHCGPHDAVLLLVGEAL